MCKTEYESRSKIEGMWRSKINLEKIRAALLTTFPHCREELKPPEWVRIDGERIRCAKCGFFKFLSRGSESP